MSCLIQWWRIMFSLGISLSHTAEYFFCQFLPVCSSCSHPHHHAAFWGESCHAVSKESILHSPSCGDLPEERAPSYALSLWGLSFARHVWIRAFLFVFVFMLLCGDGGHLTTISFPLRLVWTCQLLCWCNSKPPYAISTACSQCRRENCHLLHLKCYEWRPFTFLPLTTYLKYWRVDKLFN